MIDLMLKDVPKEFADKLLNNQFVEVVTRDANKRFDQFKKLIVQEAKNTQNKGNDNALGIVMDAVNLAATIACTIIICNKLNEMDHQLDEIKKELGKIKDVQIKTTILPSDAKLVEDYKIYARRMEKGDFISREEMLEFIRNCNRNINELYLVSSDVSFGAIQSEIFILLPMMCNFIMLYYQKYYSTEDGKHELHEDWIHTIDKLKSKEFLAQVQDYLFIDKHQRNKDVNEYLACQVKIVSEFKQQIEQLIEDLKTCEGVEGYAEAMKWSRQYAAQQAKAIRAELESKYGTERAGQIVDRAMRACEI